MALIKCPECSREISDKAELCPHCGFPLSQLPATPSAPMVDCLGCKTPISLDVEVCPSCGLFNSQKYKDYEQPQPERPQTSSQPAPAKAPAERDHTFIIFLSTVIALFMGWITGSVLVGIFTFIVAAIANVRVQHLAKNPKARLKYERHLYGWKGGVGYIVIVMCIVGVQGAVKKHSEAVAKQAEFAQKLSQNRKHLSEAKALLSKATLTDGDWLAVKNHLASIPSDAAEYTESRSLLPKVTAKTDVIEKVRQEEQRKREAAAEKRRFEAETAGLNAKGKRLKARHPEWTIEECDAISNGKIFIGMTAEQVRAAWGRPYDINRSVGSYGTHEQWVMHEMGNTYVYFENGICTSMQGVR